MKKKNILSVVAISMALILTACGEEPDMAITPSTSTETTTESSVAESTNQEVKESSNDNVNNETNADVSQEAESDAASNETFTFEGYSDNTIGSIMQLMDDAIGEDKATAEKMIGEFFGVELVDQLGDRMTAERGGIVSQVHTYSDYFVKDTVRFNGLEIWNDTTDGHVRRVELSLGNYDNISAYVEYNSEFKGEVKSLYEDIDTELSNSLGQPMGASNVTGDDDSFWALYANTDNYYVYEVIFDRTEPGGNGLMSTKLIFADEINLAR